MADYANILVDFTAFNATPTCPVDTDHNILWNVASTMNKIGGEIKAFGVKSFWLA